MALLWNFRYYPLRDTSTGVRNVYENASRAVQGKFFSRLVTLAQLDISQWREPLFKTLTNQSGLSEIRFKAEGVQQRPLGFRSGQHEYTLLLWATERGGRFVPRSACETAKSRMTEVIADRELTDALWLTLE